LSVGWVGLWYPLGLYALFYYQTGLINRVVVPQFMDGFFMNLDVRILCKFPGFFLHEKRGDAFFNEFFHFCYFSNYLIVPLTGILLYRKDHHSAWGPLPEGRETPQPSSGGVGIIFTT